MLCEIVPTARRNKASVKGRKLLFLLAGMLFSSNVYASESVANYLKCSTDDVVLQYKIDAQRGIVYEFDRRHGWEKVCDTSENWNTTDKDDNDVHLIKICKIERDYIHYLDWTYDSKGTTWKHFFHIDRFTGAFSDEIEIANTPMKGTGSCRKMGKNEIPQLPMRKF